ncbi:hypothetical protein, partial [Streptomyces sp. NPDC059928]|uniref:hypothetical protein n=2 Tax=unclassified Streptomyces TaxID=2593676 RepID=UPI0036559C54
MTNARSPLRTLRAAMFAALCVALAAMGHAAMSGHDIPPTVLLAAFAVTGGLAWCAAGRQRGVAAIAGGQVAAQGALHILFSRTRPMSEMAGTADAPASAGGHATHAMAGMPGMADGPAPMAMPMPTMTCGARYAHLMPDPPDGSAVTDMPGTAGGSLMDAASHAHALGLDAAAHTMSGGMLAAHLLAALVCGIWLWRGEAAAFRLARAVGALGVLAAAPLRRALALVRTRTPALPPPTRRPHPHPRPRQRLRGAVHSHAVIRRGPPGLLAARAMTLGLLVSRAMALGLLVSRAMALGLLVSRAMALGLLVSRAMALG